MNDYVDSQHQEHIPIRNSRIAVDRYGVHHHETAYQETDHNGKLGVDKLTVVVRLRDLDKHQKSCKNH